MIKKIVKNLIKRNILHYKWFESPFWYPRADVSELKKLKERAESEIVFGGFV